MSELSIAPFLRALVAIAARDIEELNRFGEALLPLFFVLISNNGGDFRDQANRALPFVLKAIELFCDFRASLVDEEGGRPEAGDDDFVEVEINEGNSGAWRLFLRRRPLLGP